MFSGLQTTVRASGGGVEIAEREIDTKIYIYDITPINLILNASLDFLFLNMAQICNIGKLWRTPHDNVDHKDYVSAQNKKI